jgi:hypothetical protein
VVASLSAEHGTPAENLVSPDAVRRLCWEPPDPPDEAGIAAALAGYGARPWQTGLLAGRIARAWAEPPPPPEESKVPETPEVPEMVVTLGAAEEPGTPGTPEEPEEPGPPATL